MSNLENEGNNLIDESPTVEEVSAENVIVDAPEATVEAPKEDNSVITAEISEEPAPVQALGDVHGVIGATTMVPEPKKPVVKKTKKNDNKETVAIHSSKNVTWPGVGKVYVGYNIVTKEESEKWLTRSHIRLATPQEVAKEFGK
jgi:hypothetical protein